MHQRRRVVATSSGVYVTRGSRLHRVTGSGAPNTELAGSTRGFADGVGDQAQFDLARGGFTFGGQLYVLDTGNSVIRRIG